MELTEDLKKEFILSLQRLSDTIDDMVDTGCYDYRRVYDIHKTYIEFCKAFLSIDKFGRIPLNMEIKIPRYISKFNWAGSATIKDIFISRRFSKRNYLFEEKTREMFREMNPNLQLIRLYLSNPELNINDSSIKELITTIKMQPDLYKRKIRKENVKIFILVTLFIFLGIAISVFKFIYSDLKYKFKNTEIGHAFSYVLDLNDFYFDISEKQKESCKVFWNDEIIYENGKRNKKNIGLSRNLYGENIIKIQAGDLSKTYWFYKENSWGYNKFSISVNNKDITLYIDGEIQIEQTPSP